MYNLLVVKFLKLITGTHSQGNNKFKGLACSVHELLSYVNPRLKTLETRSSSIPSTFSKLSRFNNPTLQKHYAEKLEKITLLLLLAGITSRLEKVYASQQSFLAFKGPTDLLAESVFKYIDYLGQVSKMVSAFLNNEDEPMIT